MSRKLKIGVAGLGRGFAYMLPTFRRDPRIALVAAADARKEALAHFAADFGAKTYDTVEQLCGDPDVDLIYVATPHQFHAQHTRLAAQAGKHLLIEKPMAISLDECRAMIAAARAAGVQLCVGHSHSFDAPIARARALIESGEFGPVRMIAALNFTDFMQRPRRPEELDTAQGGGVGFSQAAHQVDVVRRLAGKRALRVRAMAGAWDRARPTEGAYAALLSFEDGVFATLTYNGYGHFDSDEWQGWIGETGHAKTPHAGRVPRAFGSAAEEAAFKQSGNYGGAHFRESPPPQAHQHFGAVVVSCALADLRPLPNGVMVHRDGAGRLEPLPAPEIPRAEVIDEIVDAVLHGKTPRHNGEWAMATLEICLAILQSGREGRDIELRHQGACP